DHWLDGVRRDHAVHRLEHLGRADRDALQVGALAHDQAWIEFGRGATEIADHADLAAKTDGAERLGEGARASDLDDVIDAASAGELHRRLLPVRRGLVIDSVAGAELL